MQFGYMSGPSRTAKLAKQLLAVAGVASALPIVWPSKAKAVPEAPARVVAVNTARPTGPDPRAVRLRRFLSKLHCPVAVMSEDFVHAADDNQLDWRLLPSIAVIESSGGKAYKNNNIFGWGIGGPLPFPSIRAGLNMVAFKLGQSALYRNLDIAGKLRVYNPNASYPGRVIDVMNRISRVSDLGFSESAQPVHRQGEYIYAN